MKKIFNPIIVIAAAIHLALAQLPVALAQEAAPAAPAAEAAPANTLRDFLSGSGIIIPNKETNSLTVMDYLSNLDKIEQYLSIVDVKPQQVLIEAKVVEVKLEKEHSMGVNWSLFANQGGWDVGQFNIGSTQGGAINQEIPFRQVKWEPISGEDEDPFTIGIFDDNINIVLQALTTQLKTNILSAPKISTVNNLRAKINVVKTVPYLREVTEEEEESSGGTTTTKIIYEYDYTDEGVILEVTPQINPDGTITMLLYPQVKEIVRWHEMPGPAAAARNPELPETDIRTAQTKVNIRNGQTLVIGGLIREKTTDGQTKVPLFGDIPFIKHLFGNTITSTEKTELLIFVSPTIITPDQTRYMAKQDKYGLGKGFSEERNKSVKEMYANERLANAQRSDVLEQALKNTQQNLNLISYLNELEVKQKNLTQERQKLENKILNQEKKVVNLKDTEKQLIDERKRLEGAVK